MKGGAFGAFFKVAVVVFALIGLLVVGGIALLLMIFSGSPSQPKTPASQAQVQVEERVLKLFSQNQILEALQVAQENVDMAKREKESSHPDVAWSLYVLASAHYRMKQYEEAEKDLNQALEILKKTPEDTRQVETIIALAAIERMQGNYELAETHYQQALGILGPPREPTISFGKEKPNLFNEKADRLSVLSHLADIAQIIGRYEQAEALYRQILEEQEKQAGGTKQDLGSVLGNALFSNDPAQSPDPCHLSLG